MTTTRVYKSTDSSAPVLVGGVSSLIDLLDKCLVTGYGSQTAAGWSKPYTGTNKAAFRNSVAAGGTGMYLRVEDAGAGTGGAREALCRAYLTMTDVDTGTVETPTVAQLAASIVWRKSNTVDSTAREWILVADELTFYLCVSTGTTGTDNGAGTYAAGDFQSFVASDPHRFFIAGRETQHAAGAQGLATGLMSCAEVRMTTPSSTGFWIARGYAGTGNPIRAAIAMLALTLNNNPGVIGCTLGSIANAAGLENVFLPAVIATEGTVRGMVRGVYVSPNNLSGIAAGTNIVSPPGLASTITALRHNSSSGSYAATTDGHVHVDILSEWVA